MQHNCNLYHLFTYLLVPCPYIHTALVQARQRVYNQSNRYIRQLRRTLHVHVYVHVLQILDSFIHLEEIQDGQETSTSTNPSGFRRTRT